MKEFKSWMQEKEKLEDTAAEILRFHEREIWWCSIGINLGDEQDGKNELFERPVLVIKKFNNRICWVVPLSTKIKKGKYYYVLTHEDKEFTVLLSQLRLMSVKRFRRYLRRISPKRFSEIVSAIQDMLPK